MKKNKIMMVLIIVILNLPLFTNLLNNKIIYGNTMLGSEDLNLKVNQITNQTVNLQWNSVTDATYYELMRDDILIYSGTNLLYQDVNLLENTSYTYSVIAKNDTESSVPSQITVKTNNNSMNLRVVSKSKDSVYLQWDAIPTANLYRLYRNKVEIYSGNSLTYIDTNLFSNTNYSYTVVADVYGDNEINNGGFEVYTTSTGLADQWESASSPSATVLYSIDNDKIYEGLNSQKISGYNIPLYEMVAIRQTFSILPNKNYFLSAKINVESLNGAYVQVYVDYLENNTVISNTILRQETNTNGFIELSDYVTTPTNANKFSVYAIIRSISGNGEGVIYIDDFKFNKQEYSSVSVTTDSVLPLNLTLLSKSNKNIDLSWDNVLNGSNYKLYQNNKLIYTGLSSTYVDNNVIDGSFYNYKITSDSPNTNLLSNASFESYNGSSGIADFWGSAKTISSGFSYNVVGNPISDGVKSQRIEGNNIPNSGFVAVHQKISVKPNAQYLFGSNIYVESLSGAYVQLYADFTSNGTIVGSKILSYNYTTTQYLTLQEYITSPSNADSVIIYAIIRSNSASGRGVIYVDNYKFENAHYSEINLYSDTQYKAIANYNEIDIAWESVTNAQSYEIARNGEVVYAGKHLKFIDKGLKTNTSYNYIIYAYYNAVKYPIAVFTKNTLSANMRVTEKNAISARLEWDSVPNVTKYEVYRNSVLIYTGLSNSFLDTGLTSNTNYNYELKIITAHNSLQNSSFDELYNYVGTADGWLSYYPSGVNASFELIKDRTYSGVFSQKIKTTNAPISKDTFVYRDIPINPNKPFTLSSYVKVDYLSNMRFELCVDFYNSTNQFLGGFSKYQTTTTSEYVNLSLSGVTPSNTNRARIYLLLRGVNNDGIFSNGSGVVAVDNVRLISDNINQIPNADFENFTPPNNIAPYWEKKDSPNGIGVYQNNTAFVNSGLKSQSVLINNVNANNYALISQLTKIIPSTKLELDAYLYITSLTNAKVHRVVDFLDANKQYISSSGTVVSQVNAGFNRFNHNVVAPSNAHYAYIYISVKGDTNLSSGTVFIDDVGLKYEVLSSEYLSVTTDPGVFNFNMPTILNFNTIQLDGTLQETFVNISNFVIENTDNLHEGWVLQVSANQFKSISNPSLTLPRNSLYIKPPELINKLYGTTDDITNSISESTFIDNEIPITFLNANQGKGMYEIIMPTNALGVKLYPASTKVDLLEPTTIYETNIHFNLVSGP